MGIVGSREDGEGVECYGFSPKKMCLHMFVGKGSETKRWGSYEKVSYKDSKDEGLPKTWSGKDQRHRGEKGKRNRLSLKVETDR